MWLIDSTKYIDWIRQGKNPTRILRTYVLSRQIAMCGIIRVEVIRGAIKPVVKKELTELFDAMTEVDVTPVVWSRIAELAWTLDRQGMVLPASNLIIAGCARQIGATVVTLDPHFSRITDLSVCTDLPALPPELTRGAFLCG